MEQVSGDMGISGMGRTEEMGVCSAPCPARSMQWGRQVEQWTLHGRGLAEQTGDLSWSGQGREDRGPYIKGAGQGVLETLHGEGRTGVSGPSMKGIGQVG